MARFDDPGAGSQPPGGEQAGQDVLADGACQVDDGVGDDACGVGELAGLGPAKPERSGQVS
jgi:hypothetical protein